MSKNRTYGDLLQAIEMLDRAAIHERQTFAATMTMHEAGKETPKIEMQVHGIGHRTSQEDIAILLTNSRLTLNPPAWAASPAELETKERRK